MTRRLALALAVVGFAGLSCAGGRDEEFVVIVHPSNRFDALSRSKLNFLFMRKVSRWPWGAEVEPVDLDARSPARQGFLEQVLHITEEQIDNYWIDQRATRGVSPPIRVSSAAEAKKLVAARPGAIAYIPRAELDRTVKIVKVDP